MNLEVYSDLHLEFDKNQGRKFMHHMNPEDTDVLILAGDITMHRHLPYVVRTICEKYAPKPVLYVAGNHEYYGSGQVEVCDTLNRLMDEHPNFHWLDNDTFEHEGVRFAGTTMWFKDKADNAVYEDQLNDFKNIDKGRFREWVYKANHEARLWLREHMGDVDVVITHHAPCEMSVHPAYIGDQLNRFYVTEWGWDLGDHLGPPLWIHGHTHWGVDYHVGKTRIYSNPKGYPSQPARETGYRGRHLIQVAPRSTDEEGS